jgi:chaperonin GroES
LRSARVLLALVPGRFHAGCFECEIAIGAAKQRIHPHQEMFMKFRPLHDRVVVERIDPEAKSAGGIIIPDTAKEKPSQGEIIAVGPGGRDEAGKLIPIDLKVGDRVLFGKWSGTEVKLDSVDYLIMKESDIMGVLQETVAKKKAA